MTGMRLALAESWKLVLVTETGTGCDISATFHIYQGHNNFVRQSTHY